MDNPDDDKKFVYEAGCSEFYSSNERYRSKDQVAGISYERRICRRCQISSRVREESRRKTEPYSSTDRSRSTSEIKGVRKCCNRNERDGRCGWNEEFSDLPQDLVKSILCRLPFMSLYQTRLVSRQWNAIISSIISCSQGRKLWAKSKPAERWLLLYNEKHEVLFFDVRKKVCYNWPKFWPLTTESDSQHLCFMKVTSLKGIVFVSVCRALEVHMNTSMWECNPITGAYEQLPVMPHNTVWVGDMVAVSGANSLPGSYKLVVFSSDYDYPGKSRLQVYDSLTMLWEEVAKPIVSGMWLPEVVKNVGVRNETVSIFDKYQTHLHDPSWKFYSYNVYENEWIKHRVQAFQRGDETSSWQQCEIFERHWELILMVIYKGPESSTRARLWRKPLPLKVELQTEPLPEPPWHLLSTMPDAMKIVVSAEEGEEEMDSCSDRTNFAETSYVLDDKDLKTFALGDATTGDRLVLISIQSNYVIIFNFSKAPHEAWTAIPFSALECPSRQDPLSDVQKPVRGSGPGSSHGSTNRSEEMADAKHRLLRDRSMIARPFDPDVRRDD